MTVEHHPDGSLSLSDLDPFLVGLLREITTAADPGDHTGARERLFSVPTEGDAEADEEWREFVHPDLAHIFASASETVLGDLAQLDPPTGGEHAAVLKIPHAHVEAWLNTLNRARLVLSERFDFQEEEMNRMAPRRIDSERAEALVQVYFYGIMQEILLRE